MMVTQTKQMRHLIIKPLKMQLSLKEVRDSLDNSYFAAQPGVEAKAQELYAQNPQAAVKYLSLIHICLLLTF